MFDFMGFVAAVQKLSADVRNKAGIAAVIADAAAIFQLIAAAAHQVQPNPSPPPLAAAPPAGLTGANAADALDRELGDLQRVGAGPAVGQFGDGNLLKKFLPLIMQALMAALTGA